MADIEGLFRGTTRRRTRVRVCLRGDLATRFAALERELHEARKADADSFAGGAEREVVTRLQALRAEMAAAEVEFEFEALAPGRPLQVVAEHAPRPDNDIDRLFGFNQATYYNALIRESCVSVTDDAGVTAAASDLPADAWEAMLTGLGDGDFELLADAAADANGRATVPFSRIDSLISQSSDVDSKPRKRGASPRSGSTAGSRGSKPSMSTTTPEGSSAP